MTDIAAPAMPWYRALTPTQWRTLLAANLGWLFDGYETYALLLTVGPAMHALLPSADYPHIPAFIGIVVAITLLGWGVGGLCGGIVADYIGRKRTMIYAILAYAILTGLTAVSFSWISFALLRFLVGIAIGSEWATGSSMMAELWPKEARGKGASLMQCGFGIGFFLAAFVWLFISGFGPQAWRYMFLIGVLPALLVLWIRVGIDESRAWQQSDARRRQARVRKQHGAALSADDQALNRFTVADLFADPEICRRTILVFLLSFS
ncbi:MAG: MFS transporter, partial [Pseudomonadota bacterium]